MKYIEFKNVSKFYDNEDIKVLNNINFSINKGELVIISGPPYSGKTTILNLIGSLQKPNSGDIIVNNIIINNLKQKDIINFRKEYVGIVKFEDNLIEDLNVLENVLISKNSNKEFIDINSLFEKFKLTEKVDFLINNLSTCEKIKLMFIKALAKKPKILLCDDVFCLFDLKTKKQILKFLTSLSKKEKITIIIASNNNHLFSIANRIITLKNNTIYSIKENKKNINIGDLKC